MTLTGCAVYKPYPPGQIPPPSEPPTSHLSQTATLVTQAASQIGGSVRTTGEDFSRLQKIWYSLTLAAGAPPYWYPIVIIDHPTMTNAAMVDGSIAQVYSRLVNRITSDDDLAVVLSHELAHALLKHNENASDIKSNKAGSALFGAILGGVVGAIQARNGASQYEAQKSAANFSNLGTKIAEGATVKRYQREQEYDADRVGILLMAKACYDPNLAPEFWSQRATQVFESTRGLTSFFDTHPLTDERADNLKASLPAAQAAFLNNCQIIKEETKKEKKKTKVKKRK